MSGIASTGIAPAFQSIYRALSPAQFVGAFGGKGLAKAHAGAQTSINPGAQPVPAAIHSKGSPLVLLNGGENAVQFHALDTPSAKDHMDGAMGILGSLNFGPPSIASTMAGATATVKTDQPPVSGLAGLAERRLADRIQRAHGGSGGTAVTPMRLGPVRSRGESLTVTVEPFGNDPEGSYYVDVRYATKTVDKFNIFMEKIGEEMFHDIVAGAKNSG